MGRRRTEREADVIVGVIRWQGSEAGPADKQPAETDVTHPVADVIVLEAHRRSRRGRAAAPPRQA